MSSRSTGIPPAVVLELHVAPSATGGGGESVRVTLRLTTRDETRTTPYSTRVDRQALLRLENNVTQYGEMLSAAIFAPAEAGMILTEALTAAGSTNAPVRLLLSFEPEVSYLGQLRWERMLDPTTREPFALLRRVFITRHCHCDRLLMARIRGEQLRSAVIAVASPAGLIEERFPRIDRAAHEESIAQSVQPLVPRVLQGRVSLSELSKLSGTPADLLAIVCHGVQATHGGARLWFDGDLQDSEPDPVDAGRFVSALNQAHLPHLVVLGSCYSGTVGEDPAPAFAPALVEAGVPYVLAIHGAITPEMLAALLRAFLAELMRTGHVEEAVRVARTRLNVLGMDWALPVLYSRQWTERVVRVGSMPRATRKFNRWPALRQAIETGKCVPVVGWDADPELHPTRDQFATEIANMHGLPGSQHKWTIFSEVARYVAATQGNDVLLDYCRQIMDEAGKAYTKDQEDVAQAPSYSPNGLLGKLAQLPLPVYITTSWFDGLSNALRDAGRNPQLRYAGMRINLDPQVPISEAEVPSTANPLVFHLNGHWSDPSSLVGADDEYLVRAIAFGEDPVLLPDAVRRSLAENLLLVCGIDVSDLDLRLVLALHERFSAGSKRGHHVTLQLERVTPEGEPDDELEQLVQDYLVGSELSVFWGTAQEFVHEFTEVTR